MVRPKSASSSRLLCRMQSLCYTFHRNSGVVQLVARQPLELSMVQAWIEN